MDGVMSMTMNGDMTYTATTEKPQTTPAAGEKVVDITLIHFPEGNKASPSHKKTDDRLLTHHLLLLFDFITLKRLHLPFQ